MKFNTLRTGVRYICTSILA